MKQLIKLCDVEGIKTYYNDIMQQNYDIDIQNIYKELIYATTLLKNDDITDSTVHYGYNAVYDIITIRL